MKVEFDKSFLKDLKNLPDKETKKQLQTLIESIEQVDTLEEITQLKKLTGYDHYYRVRVRDYRVGLLVQGEVVWLVRCLHRKDIYRYFP